jgi:hypothetical protein
VRGVTSEKEIKCVRRMVVAIRNTCGMFYKLLQVVNYRKGKSFGTSPVIRGGAQPILVVYVEVPGKKDFGVWVGRKQ